MTENEAIKGLKNLFSEHELNLPCTDSLEILHIAIEALEEIQKYRSIDTVEECREAMEKQIPKKPVIGNDNGKSRSCCARCGCFFLPTAKYCSKCGQAINRRNLE